MSITQASAHTAGDIEAERLDAVQRYAILDTPPDAAFDRIAHLAARCLGTPIATVAIIDAERTWFKACYGVSGTEEIRRGDGQCAAALFDDGPFVVRDALTDPRGSTNPFVQDAWGITFFAAAPIVTPDGHRIGAVSVLDTTSHDPTDDDIAILSDLAAIVMDELDLRLSALTTVHTDGEPLDTAESDKATLEDYVAALQRSLLPPSGRTWMTLRESASSSSAGGWPPVASVIWYPSRSPLSVPNITVQNFCSLGSPTSRLFSSASPSVGSSWWRAAARRV